MEVIDDSRNWWYAKNKFGKTGYISSTLLEVALPPKRFGAKKCKFTIHTEVHCSTSMLVCKLITSHALFMKSETIMLRTNFPIR